MIPISLIPVRFCPSRETLEVLNGRNWIASYSGGKDSTALVTWVEWLRRTGIVTRNRPRLVMSDTTVEYPFLAGIAARITAALSRSGWSCDVVTPKINEKLYNRIFGVGNTPVHPGKRKAMRWCTRSTKIDPMKRFAAGIADDVIQLSGVRWGESDVRDGKLAAGGCQAGGECGLPNPGDGVYGPIISWKLCKVIEWLSGDTGDEVTGSIADLLPAMRELVEVYDVKQEQDNLFGEGAKLTGMRFGCIGCPAISNEKVTRSRAANNNPNWVHLRRIYRIWQELYLRRNRCCRIKKVPTKHTGPKPTWFSDHVGFGPIKMEARKRYFAELLDVQEKSGVTLVTPEDVAFIHDCWRRKVYPRGWSEADESVVPPEEGLFASL